MIYPLILYTDVIHGIAKSSFSQSYNLTQLFLAFVAIPATTFCSVIIRLVTIFCCRNTVNLLICLKNDLSYGRLAGQNAGRRAFKTVWTNRFFLFACIVRIIVEVTIIFRTFLSPSQQNANLPLLTVPSQLWVCLGAFLFVFTSGKTAFAFALGLIVIVGVALLNAQGDLYQMLYQNCCGSSDGSTKLPAEGQGRER